MHNPINLTDHARIRSQQRAIPLPIIEVLIQYGKRSPAGRGCRLVYLDKKRLQKITREMPDPIMKIMDKKRDCYLIIDGNESVITVGHRTRKILH